MFWNKKKDPEEVSLDTPVKIGDFASFGGGFMGGSNLEDDSEEAIDHEARRISKRVKKEEEIWVRIHARREAIKVRTQELLGDGYIYSNGEWHKKSEQNSETPQEKKNG